MRKIVKTHAPKTLREWCSVNKNLNHSYDDLRGSQAYKDLKEKLLDEQGKICAYTGRTISFPIDSDHLNVSGNWHVEHLKPQNQCDEWEDVEYRNVVACFPADGGDTSYGYGAPVKGGWWDETLFVSPLSDDCERRFRFSWSGHIYPNPEDHRGAKKTIEVLELDNKFLRELRKARIYGFFGFGRHNRQGPISVAEAQTALEKIDQFDNNGYLREFCFVLKQLLPKYIENGGSP